MIRQGEVYWVRFEGRGSEPAGRRPAVIVQDDRYNRTTIATTIVAAVTSNLALAAAPGNVRLRKGEASLPRASVVNVTQLLTLDRERLDGKLGMLSGARVRAIVAGLVLVLGIDRLAE